MNKINRIKFLEFLVRKYAEANEYSSGVTDSERDIAEEAWIESYEVNRTSEEVIKDAARWRWLVVNTKLGFRGAPSWDAVLDIPMLNADDHTLDAIVDRAMQNG